MQNILDYFLNLDSHLFTMILDYGTWVYAILFLIIFVETGLVVLPFLPGDSLLFAAGTFCAGVQNEAGDLAQLNLWIIILSLTAAAILGDSLNYYLGKTIGLKVLAWKIGGKNLVSQKHIDRTKSFFEKHGSKTIIIARFVPIVRTFAPFVAGIGDMHYGKFIRFNIIGGGVWVLVLTLTGYFFGNLPFVKNNFEYVILGIVALSLIPVILQFFRKKT
ncbi:DedA family protein [Gramella sp. AN32]|uniref:DedA family protein n=1 Tax=Christiangramia antarctica TaxID=2058158 RepID=A0ABW5X151_9FLAO|nr:DedA family protein [Gramella sp. AN32]MCM4157939.1 DedA family protein [Gramella sp. AN32]